MKLSRLFGAFAVVLAAGLSTAAFAAGMFENLPVVEGAAYCALYAGDGTTCAGNVPAGPTAVTGNEQIPADTNLPRGQSPQTVLFTLANLNALPLTTTTVTAASVTLPAAATASAATVGGYFLHLGSGVGAAMTAVTINLPSAPVDGQQFVVSGDANVTTLTLTAQNLPAGVLIKLNPTALSTTSTAPYGYRLVYNATLNQWGRLQ